MSKTTWTVIIVVILIVAGYFIFSSNKGVENVPMGPESQAPEKKMAFAEFVKQGGSYKCEIKNNINDAGSSGTVYVSDGVVKGELNTLTAGKMVTTYFLVRDGFSYAWFSTDPTKGFKIKEDTSVSASSDWASQIGDYNCEPWTADRAMFEVPASVTFQEIEPK